MNWNRYLEIKKNQFDQKNCFWPENQSEAKQALALGVIDIGQYVEFSMTTEPLLDAVHDPDPNVRKGSIRRIAEQKSPFSIKILHNMLTDPDEEVRLYAASELDRLESEKQKQIYQLRENLKNNKHDQAACFELAQTYIDYSNILLTSINLKFFFLTQAIELLNNLLSNNSKNANFYYYRGLAFKLLNEKQKALIDLKQAVDLNKQHIKAYSTLAEIYFSQHKFDYVKKIMDLLPAKKQDIEEINAQLFWKN